MAHLYLFWLNSITAAATVVHAAATVVQDIAVNPFIEDSTTEEDIKLCKDIYDR